MELLIYVLHGAWHTEDTDGTGVLWVAEEIEPLLGKLHEIAAVKAKGYVELRGHTREEHGERFYEAIDGDGRYAKFYVMEEHLHISGRALGRAILKKVVGRRMVCRRCGSKVRREREAGLREEYPYYCPRCDENMYSFECMEMRPRERRRMQCRKWAAKIRKKEKHHERPSDVVELKDEASRRYFYVDGADFEPVRFSPFLAKPMERPVQSTRTADI